jgi:hypothetical protein
VTVEDQAGKMVRQLIRNLNAQVATAMAAGADQEDLCIVLPAGYIAFAAGMPLIDLDGKVAALAPMKAAEGMVRTLEAESGWGAPL